MLGDDRSEVLSRMYGSPERVARMSQLAHQAILAYVDQNPDALDTVITQVADECDKTVDGQAPAAQIVLREIAWQVSQSEQVAQTAKVTLAPDYRLLRQLIREVTPQQYRDEAAVPIEAAAQHNATTIAMTGEGLPAVCAAAAVSAEMLLSPKLFPARHMVRYTLTCIIAAAARTAAGETTSPADIDITDEAAIDLIESVMDVDGGDTGVALPDPMRIPRQRDEWGLHEFDMVALTKTHLLQYPTPTTQQQAELADGLATIISQPQKYYQKKRQPARTGPPVPKPRGQQRTQPKRASRAKRKKK